MTLAARLREADYLVLLLDYDGTLVPFAAAPELAIPDQGLLALLTLLTGRARTEVHVVSGRKRDTLEAWLGDLPLWLHAEHGASSRSPGNGTWSAFEVPETPWREAVRRILDEYAARTPGSPVEEKTMGLAWHYRMAAPDFGAAQARELTVHLRELLTNQPVEILPGARVIEVRPHGMLAEQGLISPAPDIPLAGGHPCPRFPLTT